MDLAVVDLENNGINELIGAWEGIDSTVSLYVMAPNYKSDIPIDKTLIQGFGEQRRIFVVKGDFDGDHQDEFVVAFIDINKVINIRLYDSDGTLTPVLKSSISDEDLSGNPLSMIRFSAHCR